MRIIAIIILLSLFISKKGYSQQDSLAKHYISGKHEWHWSSLYVKKEKVRQFEICHPGHNHLILKSNNNFELYIASEDSTEIDYTKITVYDGTYKYIKKKLKLFFSDGHKMILYHDKKLDIYYMKPFLLRFFCKKDIYVSSEISNEIVEISISAYKRRLKNKL
jgi:hypothetical protein